MLPVARKIMLLVICTTVLWVPAASVAGDSSRSSASTPAEREPDHSKSDTSSPAKTCKRQLNGGKARDARENAFGKCVSKIAIHKTASAGKDSAESKDKGDAESRHKKSTNPAMTCKAMRADDLAQFQAAYGTRPNAFGKCVAKRANSTQG
jgi:hypothetical protein